MLDHVLSRRGRALLARAGVLFARLSAGLRDNYGGAEPALCQLAVLVAALVLGVDAAATFWPKTAGYILGCAGVLALLELGLWLAGALLRRFLGHGLRWLMALALLIGAVAYTVKRGAGEGWTWRVWVFSGIAAAVLWVLAASWWALTAGRRRNLLTVSTGVISTASVALLAVFLFTDGFSGRDMRQYMDLAPEAAVEDAGAFDDAAEDGAVEQPVLPQGPGPCEVKVVDYGPDAQLEAGTVSLTAYMSRDTGDLVGDYVDAYWDYNLSAVPLRGRVWYPVDRSNCPVLFIAHGNHEIRTESYLGYAYLGEYLASYGYVVVSVDENACNMLYGENDGRAVLLLKHIGLLLDYNGEVGNPLRGKLDADNLAIAGHSRGGEMVATAYLFNDLDRYPENGTIRFDYHYHIRSIVAIAPTVDQYKPAGHSVEIADVNYLLLHGAADRDVTDFMGMSQYDHLSFTGQGDYLKTALYIAGANHGQFNSLWGAYDQHGAHTSLLNAGSLLPQEEQQRIAQLFIKVFLDVTLRGDESCAKLLTDWDSYRGQLSETAYYQCWESSRFTPIADFEEDADLETASMEGAALQSTGASLWTEELMQMAGSRVEDTHALRLRWVGKATYTVTTPELDLTDSSISFDICDLDSKAVERGEYALVDGAVRLTDADGRTAQAAISDFATIFPILQVRTDKLDFLFRTCVYKKAMATVAIPAGDFLPGDGAFDASRVVEIAFIFSGGGEIAMDNIGIEG